MVQLANVRRQIGVEHRQQVGAEREPCGIAVESPLADEQLARGGHVNRARRLGQQDAVHL